MMYLLRGGSVVFLSLRGLVHFVLFNNDGTEFALRADEDSTILVLSGEPIDEPIASYGPFVMNTNEEIKQTIDDFNSGKFGYLD